jgi:hypothetical protein
MYGFAKARLNTLIQKSIYDATLHTLKIEHSEHKHDPFSTILRWTRQNTALLVSNFYFFLNKSEKSYSH